MLNSYRKYFIKIRLQNATINFGGNSSSTFLLERPDVSSPYLAFIGTGDGFWARGSLWLLGAAIVMALLAALAGFIDFFGEARIRRLNDVWYHMIGNLCAVVVALANFMLRYQQGPETAIKPWGVVLSLVVVGILLFTGWKGWELVYRGRVGVAD